MKAGDRVVCIGNIEKMSNYEYMHVNIGNIYTIIAIIRYGHTSIMYRINNNDNFEAEYESYNFISIREHRRLKLNKINKNNIEYG
jgi:hypothetical protein